MTDPRSSLQDHLRLAIEAYGEDQTLPVARVAGRPIPARPAAPAVARTGAPPASRTAAAAAPAAAAPIAARVGDPAPDPTAAPATLEQLRAEASTCRKCRLCETRTHVVFGEGNPRARVMFVGEAPGQTEDETGRPFVGRAGQLLTRIIENAMGLAREAVYIANVNKCRPPANREPQPDEVAACLPYLRDQIRAVRPEVIVTLGKVAAANLLGSIEPMKRLRGRTLEFEGIPVIATWHPAYLLRNPAAKTDTWDDVKRVNRLLGLPEVPPPYRPPSADTPPKP